MISKSALLFISFLSIILLLIVAIPAISAGSENTTLSETEFQHHLHLQTDEIQFEEEVIYSETADVMFGNIHTAAIDRSGRVFMGDNDRKMVHVFSPSGRYLQSFGSRGNGPGEFQMISKIATDNDHIHVFDIIMGWINVFDAQNFSFVRAVALSENGGAVTRGAQNTGLGRPIDFFLLTDGNYLVSFRNIVNVGQRQTAIISNRGEVLEENRFEFRTRADEITESSSGSRRVVINFPFSRATGISLSPRGVLFVNWSEHLELDLYDEAGNHIHNFSHPHQNAQMDRRELLKMYENRQEQGIVMGAGGGPGGGGAGAGAFPAIEQMLQDTELPDTWPAVQSMYADPQNRIWVSSFTEKADERKWFLFDELGSLLGTFMWPASKRVVHADQNTVFVLDRPADDLDTVIRYRFTGAGE